MKKPLKKPLKYWGKTECCVFELLFAELSPRLHFVNKHDFMRPAGNATLMSTGRSPGGTSNMDAGKFNFNIGGLKPKQSSTSVQGQPKESPSVQQDPTESVVLGKQSVADAKVDNVSSGHQEVTLDATPTAKQTSSVPSHVGSFLIAGPSGISDASGVKRKSFGDLPLHGLSSTSLQGINGGTLASVNPLKPTDGVSMPTTSADLVYSTFGGGPLFTTSGRQIG
jgi:hypothetical protein